MHLQPKVFFTCSVALLIASCGVGRVATDDKGTLVHQITAFPTNVKNLIKKYL